MLENKWLWRPKLTRVGNFEAVRKRMCFTQFEWIRPKGKVSLFNYHINRRVVCWLHFAGAHWISLLCCFDDCQLVSNNFVKPIWSNVTFENILQIEIIADALFNVDIDFSFYARCEKEPCMWRLLPSILPSVCLSACDMEYIRFEKVCQIYVKTFILNFMKIWQKLLSKSGFRENRRSVVHTLVLGEHEFRRLCPV